MPSNQPTHPSTAIQAQWSLSSTSNSVFSITKGFIRAATSDNVQVIALIACESFGNTIAMSRETCLKIETDVVMTPAPAPVQFLGALVGYTAGDCVAQLGNTQAGIQFLGLASAMVTMGSFRAAEALHGMLTSSATDKTLLPTTMHLKYLLESLEPRCQSSNFASTVIGWELFLLQTLPERSDMALNSFHDYFERPSPKGVENLVDAFRRLSRIGDVSVAKATIKANKCVPWVIAFTKWCLGIPPSVFTEDGKAILEQPDTRVVVVAMANKRFGSGHFEIIIQHRLPNLPDLLDKLDAPGGSGWTGMISIQAYGKWLLRRTNPNSKSIASRALKQALPYAAKQVVDLLQFHSYGESMDRNDPNTISQEFSHLRLTPFQCEDSISEILSCMLDTDVNLKLPVLDADLLVTDLPLIKIHLETLDEEYFSLHHSDEVSLDYRVDEAFIKDLAAMTADVLALSLFCFPEKLLVSLRRFRTPDESFFVSAVEDILYSGKPTQCKVSCLLQWALKLVEHDVEEEIRLNSWILSSFKGQAVYPAIFDAYDIHKQGYLALRWLPGRLWYHGDTYSSARAYSTMDLLSGELPVVDKPVIAPCNLFPAYSLIWNIERMDSFFSVSLGLSSKTQELAPLSHSPSLVLESLSKSLLLEACPHDSNAKLRSADKFCTFIGPVLPIAPSTTTGATAPVVEIVAADGADDLRFFALCRNTYSGPSIQPAVIRKRACLNCCLDLCRKAKINLLIL
jgi:hypothetical protein